MKRTAILSVVALSLCTPTAMANTGKTKPSHTNGPAAVKADKNHAQTDAITIILKDHAYIRKMFAQLKTTLDKDVDKSRKNFNDIKDFIVKHETMEQKEWYPELEKKNGLKDIVAHLKKEEDDAGNEIKKIDDISDNAQWVAAVKKFMTAVEHHAKDEETKLFPKAKKALSKTELDSIGEKLMTYHKDNNMNY